MLILRRIAAFDVAERRVRLDNACADEVIESEQVFVLTQAVQVAPAPGQGTKVLGNDVEEALG